MYGIFTYITWILRVYTCYTFFSIRIEFRRNSKQKRSIFWHLLGLKLFPKGKVIQLMIWGPVVWGPVVEEIRIGVPLRIPIPDPFSGIQSES